MNSKFRKRDALSFAVGPYLWNLCIWAGAILLLAINVAEVYNRTLLFLGLILLVLAVIGTWFRLERRMALQHARQLQELDELKSRLHADITHEFRAPLTVIIGLNRQLLDTAATAEQRKNLIQIQDNGYRLLRLINQMDPETPETIDHLALETAASATFEGPAASPNEGKPTVLVVEDDPHISYYIHRCLHKDFHLIFAQDGPKGEEIALETVPDLIISEVMMPYQGGFELCRKVKMDERTSHIPFIMLTARAEIEDRLKGLKRGADIYLAKPFREEELRLHMHNLLAMQQRLQAYFRDMTSDEVPDDDQKPSRNSDPEPSNSPFDWQAENAFVEKVKSIIQNNISNPDFSMAELCRQMAMSSSQLHRKMTALTNEPASKLLRRMRLDNAKWLLRHTQENIGEVAFKSGFNDPSYFTRIFNKDTGMTPTEYREQFFKKES